MKKIFFTFLIILSLLLCGCNNPQGSQNEHTENGSAAQISAAEKTEPQSSAAADTPAVESVSTDPFSKKLTAEEYGRITAEYWEEYNDRAWEISDIVESAEGSFEKLKEKNSELLEACGRVKAVLDKYAEITPPDDYKELHQKLLQSIEEEKRWLTYREQAYSADTEEEGNEIYGKINEEADAMDINDTFPGAYMQIRLKLQGLG